jgi:hypothetical protein
VKSALLERWSFLEDSFRFVDQPVLTSLNFAIFFTDQARQPCVQPPTWRHRSLYLCAPATGWSNYTPRHRVPFSSPSTALRHVRWVPCHHGMALPQVADGGDGLQIWKVAANILNKQSLTADKGWSSNLEVGREASQLLTVKQKLVTKIYKKPRTWTDSLDNGPKRKGLDGSGSGYGPVEDSCEHSDEPPSSLKCWEVPEWLHNWQLVRKGSAP